MNRLVCASFAFFFTGLTPWPIVCQGVPEVPAEAPENDRMAQEELCQSLRDSARVTQELISQWWDTEAGSDEERRLESGIVESSLHVLGSELINAYREWLRADVNSAEERGAEERIDSLVKERCLDEDEAGTIASAYFSFAGGTSNPDLVPSLSSPLAPPYGMTGSYETRRPLDVGISLLGNSASLLAGAMISVQGEITNNTDSSIWIVDKYTTLSTSDELWSTSASPLIAELPSLRPDNLRGDGVVRIDPGCTYPVYWRLDPDRALESGGKPKKRSFSREINFWLFRPGTYQFTAAVHVWDNEPGRERLDLSKSTITTKNSSFLIDLPVRVLVIGGVLGGVVAFMIGLLLRLQTGPVRGRELGRFVLVGVLMALFVCAAGIVLINRVAGAGSFVTITINDFWGAAATGFVIEWFGLKAFLGSIRGPVDKRDEKPPDRVQE